MITAFFPNRVVIGCPQPNLKDMHRLMPLARNPPRQRGRELRVDEEVHAGCKTAWSAWRAA